MTEKTNIQLFDEITAKIFARLYESFPLPVSIDCIDLTQGKEIDDVGRISPESKICIATLKWLRDEDYIKLNNLGQHEAYDIILTAKGLRILKSTPDSLQVKNTLGEKLMLAIKSGAINTAVDTLKLVFAVI